MKRVLLPALLCASAACDYGFKPASLVEDMRLLGVAATPADLHPGETAALRSLLPDPTGGPTTVLWLGCDPDPFNQNRSPCANADLLQDPGSIAGDGGTLPPGLKFIGFDDNVSYSASSTVFDVLDAGDRRRISGTVGQVLAFAVSELVSPTASAEELQAVFSRVQEKQTRAIIGLYRVKVSENPERNSNPVATGLLVGGQPFPDGAHLAMFAGDSLALDLAAPDSTFETFSTTTPDGTTAASTERVLVAWYSTTGRFSELRTALREEVKTNLFAPGGTEPLDAVPSRRTGTMWAVLRDTRGGESWLQWPLFICDTSLPAAAVSSVDWPATAADPVVLHGTNLSSVLDVVVDGRALEHGGYSPAKDTWEGSLPPGVEPGMARGEFWTKQCGRLPLP